MSIWLQKEFGSKSFDVVLRDFRQHYYAMGGPEDMMMLHTFVDGKLTVFIGLPDGRHKHFYVVLPNA